MSGRSPAGPLMHEHRVIERMIAVLESDLARAQDEGRVDPMRLDQAAEFIREYADRCHHGKEEDILFRELAAKDIDSALASAMDDLIQDHIRGRALTRRLVEANHSYATGDAGALDEILEVTRELVEFYPVHIQKEDRLFFKPALAYFTAEEQASMLAEFDEFDRALIHAKYLGVVEELERGAG